MYVKLLHRTVAVFSLLFLSCASESEKAVYILPDKFAGKISIIYNHPEGVELKLQGERKVFEIPKDGTLRTNSAYSGVNKNLSRFYYKKVDGKLEVIPLSGGIMLCAQCPAIKEPNSISIVDDDYKSVWMKETNKINKVESFIVQYNPPIK